LGFFFIKQQGESLDGFPQPHIISQTGAQSPAPEEGQPGEAIALVRPEFAQQSAGLWQFHHAILVGEMFQPFRDPAFGNHLFQGQALHRTFFVQF